MINYLLALSLDLGIITIVFGIMYGVIWIAVEKWDL